MTPRTKSQNQEIRIKTSKVILGASLKLFSEKGFDHTSVDDIAKSAKISKGLVYHYFTSKDQILYTLMKNSFDEMMNMEFVIPESASPSELLSAWISQAFEQIQLQPVYLRLLFSILFQSSTQKKTSGIVKQFKKLAVDQLEQLFIRLGSPSPRTDSLILGCVLDGIGLGYVLDLGDMPMRDLEKRIHEIFRVLQKEAQ
jgi:AcrR family transcriptional regulator